MTKHLKGTHIFDLRPFKRSIAHSIALLSLSSCIATHIDQEYQDPSFSWDTLKRDEILMMPLQDLRGDVRITPATKSILEFFSDKESVEFSEKFKQVFFKNRKDIRVYGAGGAFDHVIAAPHLQTKAKKMIDRQSLSEVERNELKEGTQDIRFFMAFAMTKEDVWKDYRYEEPLKASYAVKTYYAVHSFAVTMALWDSKENKTVWTATKVLSPTNFHSYKVPRHSVIRDDHMLPVIFDANDSPFESNTLEAQLELHPNRFPEYPGREPEFSGSFQDFALALPIQPSEEKYIEYESFTYHRPEIGILGSSLGSSTLTNLNLGSSSIIHNRYRLGGGLGLPLTTSRISYEDRKYDASLMTFFASFDAEFELTQKQRLLLGTAIGFGTISAMVTDTSSTNDDTKKVISDTIGIYGPRIRILFGERKGPVWGLGLSYRAFSGIQEEIFRQNALGRWAFDASVAYTFRGF